MREIKFRAWLKKSKIMVEVLQISIESKCILMKGEPLEYVVFREFEGDDIWSGISFEDIELMQYTGLKDKNGVEIYEGDIVKIFDDGYETICVVRYENGFFDLYKKSDKTASGYENYDDFIAFTNYDYDFEVIGNIHENPEMLEV
jgi:uncharacterized phage protein (TIGR01671 family)